MDPIQRLAANNKKYAAIEKKDRNYKVITFAGLILFLYAAGFYLYASNDENVTGFQFHELTKPFWLITIAITGGIGSLFFSAGLSIIIWAEIFTKQIGAKVNGVFSTLISVASIIISVSFVFLAITFNALITENNQTINNFLMLGYSEPPFLIKMLLNYSLIFIVAIFGSLFIAIWSLPFKAKEHALEFAPNKKINKDT